MTSAPRPPARIAELLIAPLGERIFPVTLEVLSAKYAIKIQRRNVSFICGVKLLAVVRAALSTSLGFHETGSADYAGVLLSFGHPLMLPLRLAIAPHQCFVAGAVPIIGAVGLLAAINFTSRATGGAAVLG